VAYLDADLSNVSGDGRESYRCADVLEIQENKKEKPFDAVIPIDVDGGHDMKKVQIKGCFASRKGNPDRNSHLVIPYDTHVSAEDYIYHLGTYSVDEEFGGQIPVEEAVLTWEEMDVLMQIPRHLDTMYASVNSSSRGRLRCQIDPDIVMDYAEAVHGIRHENPSRADLYRIAEDVYVDHAEPYRLDDDGHLPVRRMSPMVDIDESQSTFSDFS